jgi:hypothetical protein
MFQLLQQHYPPCIIESGITLGGVLSHPNCNEKDRAATEEKIYKAFWIY